MPGEVGAVEQDGTTNTYGYDEAGRLTSWDTPTTDTSYTYDGDSNRTGITTTNASTNAVTKTVSVTRNINVKVLATPRANSSGSSL